MTAPVHAPELPDVTPSFMRRLSEVMANTLIAEDETVHLTESGETCDSACRQLPSNLRGCVNTSMVDVCEAFTSLPVEDDLLITIGVLAALFIIAALVCHFIMAKRRKADLKEEKIRVARFTSTAQFYKYEPHKTSLPNPATAAQQLYPDLQEFEQDDHGEPAAVSGASLYGKWVTRGHEPPPSAAIAMGGGRLQRLWLARGGAGGGKMSDSAERRLRRLAALRLADSSAAGAEPSQPNGEAPGGPRPAALSDGGAGVGIGDEPDAPATPTPDAVVSQSSV